MRGTLVVAALAALAAGAATARAQPPLDYFDVSALFLPPATPGADGAIAVSFLAKDPAVRINEAPAPRLKLEAPQRVLVDKQAPATMAGNEVLDPAETRYLDLSTPQRFKVAFAPGAPKGVHTVKAALTYFYCSKTAGWCRKSTTGLEVAVRVP